VDVPRPIAARRDTAIVPCIDQAFAPEPAQMSQELLSKLVVLMRVGNENLKRRSWSIGSHVQLAVLPGLRAIGNGSPSIHESGVWR
jgi:hypothetical protein